MKLIKSKRVLQVGIILLAAFFMELAVGVGINIQVKSSVKNQIISSEAAAELKDVDCMLVLGCWVKDDGVPSAMLDDRLQKGTDLYQLGVSNKLLMSGDHGTKEYDEVNTMKQYAKNKGIPSQNIFMDHAGFSTYESVYRARDIFKAKKIVIVTQKYHLYRALYIANNLEIEAYGVACDQTIYGGQAMRDLREVAARVKDFFGVVFQPKPTFLGEAIPVAGDGDLTNDNTSSTSE